MNVKIRIAAAVSLLLIAGGLPFAPTGGAVGTASVPAILDAHLPGAEAERQLNVAIAASEGRTVAVVEARVAAFNALSAAMPLLQTDPTYAGIDPSGAIPAILTTSGERPPAAPIEATVGLSAAGQKGRTVNMNYTPDSGVL